MKQVENYPVGSEIQ